jgi:hypothetical protein
MSLLDALNNKQQSIKAPAPKDDTAAAQKLLTTKATGQAAAPSAGPAASSMTEKLGLSQAKKQIDQGKLQQQLQTASLQGQEAAQEQRFEAAEARGLDKMKAMASDFQRRSNDILASFERGEKKIDDQRHAVDMETMGVQARLGNQEYTHQLDMNAKQMGLDNDLKFKEEMARTIIGDDLEFLKDDLAHRRIMSGNDREFKEEMANMDINMAIKAMEQEMKQQQMQGKYAGISGMMSAGIQGASAYVEEDLDTKEKKKDA